MSGTMRILLVQTQAENAGAQEIARVIGSGLAGKGYEISNLFFYKKSATFSEQPNTFYCAKGRPSSFGELMRLLFNLARHIRRTQPDVILTFQHYGNTIAAPVAKLVSRAPVVANQVSALRTMNKLVRAVDLMLGLTGIFKAVTVNSNDVKQVYEAYPKTYRDKLVHVAHGFAERTSHLSKTQARELFASSGQCRAARMRRTAASAEGAGPCHPHAAARTQLAPRIAWSGSGQGALDQSSQPNSASSIACILWAKSPLTGSAISSQHSTCSSFPRLPRRSVLQQSKRRKQVFPSSPTICRCCARCWPSRVSRLHCSSTPTNTNAFAMTVSLALNDQSRRASLRQNGQRLKSLYSIDRMVEDYEQILARVV